LLAIAWSDGNFKPEERELITSLTHGELASEANLATLAAITPQELAATLGNDPRMAENFLRTAVMVAIADGVYSFCEDELLYGFATALGQNTEFLERLRLTLCVPTPATSLKVPSEVAATADSRQQLVAADPHLDAKLDVLHPLKHWLDELEIQDPQIAHFLCKMIPPQCPFERDIQLFGRKLVHIPPLCKLNPLYEQLVSLRFRALCYLADECHEDVTPYC
jgi:tellurite resistance protein